MSIGLKNIAPAQTAAHEACALSAHLGSSATHVHGCKATPDTLSADSAASNRLSLEMYYLNSSHT